MYLCVFLQVFSSAMFGSIGSLSSSVVEKWPLLSLYYIAKSYSSLDTHPARLDSLHNSLPKTVQTEENRKQVFFRQFEDHTKPIGEFAVREVSRLVPFHICADNCELYFNPIFHAQ